MAQDTNNRVLRALPDATRRQAMARMERVTLEGRVMLDRSGEATRTVHFPETAVISTIATYRDGSSIEMANIGREACTGIGLTLGHPRQLSTNEVQIGGEALQIGADAFDSLMDSLPAFRTALFSTVQAIFYQVMVSGACNGAHDSRQRLARWLLTMYDRNDHATMPLTHDFLAEMLGVRRATVSETAAGLQSDGLISYSRGQVTVTDADGLRETSCECYDLVRDAYDTLLPDKSGTS
ncbi:Crp/Fnr family transcriptional regulator [Psychromarinibacter sp. C21-152]|uniref:Crp/Fnr family transcriptional regulator n=1 Tax=Psychromarinibacter sediminicola TaxID=3033385 RepID=A0AAE3NVT9_9RHOB|nr:Crp/Fnr family transcriptional regulator [Psychromarinibacter sediminicola]MDF0602956.1 Crp/Fnr family transcriptional regulator [Psychromarinibacter sediminicola]